MYDSFQDFCDKLHQIEQQSDTLFTVGECRTVENANKSIKQGSDKQYKACFKYRYVKLLCKHFGKPRPNNKLPSCCGACSVPSDTCYLAPDSFKLELSKINLI